MKIIAEKEKKDLIPKPTSQVYIFRLPHWSINIYKMGMSAPLLPVPGGMRSSDAFSKISAEEPKENLTQGWDEVKWWRKTVMKSWNESQEKNVYALVEA